MSLVQFFEENSNNNIAPTLNKLQLKILHKAYNEERYAFWNTGYNGAGTFNHCVKYGRFILTEQEMHDWKRVSNDRLSTTSHNKVQRAV